MVCFASTLLQTNLSAQEGGTEDTSSSSMFGFGDDTSRTQTPKYSQQPQNISLQQRVLQQGEKIEGLISVVEGLSASLSQLQQAEEQRKKSNEDQIVLQKLIQMVDEINASYVSKEELKRLLVNQQAVQPKVEKAVQPSAVSMGTDKQKLYSEAVRLYMKQSYDQAKERFLITADQGYKPAASYYYLGEIAYYTKQYEEAIGYFKKSAGLYDKASYIDTLLFHTAVSLENSGKKDEAKAFYQNIVDNYQDKKTAKLSQDRLKRL